MLFNISDSHNYYLILILDDEAAKLMRCKFDCSYLFHTLLHSGTDINVRLQLRKHNLANVLEYLKTSTFLWHLLYIIE